MLSILSLIDFVKFFWKLKIYCFFDMKATLLLIFRIIRFLNKLRIRYYLRLHQLISFVSKIYFFKVWNAYLLLFSLYTWVLGFIYFSVWFHQVITIKWCVHGLWRYITRPILNCLEKWCIISVLMMWSFKVICKIRPNFGYFFMRSKYLLIKFWINRSIDILGFLTLKACIYFFLSC